MAPWLSCKCEANVSSVLWIMPVHTEASSYNTHALDLWLHLIQLTGHSCLYLCSLYAQHAQAKHHLCCSAAAVPGLWCAVKPLSYWSAGRPHTEAAAAKLAAEGSRTPVQVPAGCCCLGPCQSHADLIHAPLHTVLAVKTLSLCKTALRVVVSFSACSWSKDKTAAVHELHTGLQCWHCKSCVTQCSSCK